MFSSIIKPATPPKPGNSDSQSQLKDTKDLIDFCFGISKLLQSAKLENLADFDNQQVRNVIKEFSDSANPATIFIIKTNQKTSYDTADASEEDSIKFLVTNSLNLNSESVSTVVLIKERGALVANQPLDQQIQVLNLPKQFNFFEKGSFDDQNEANEHIHSSRDQDESHAQVTRKSYEMLKTLISLGISPYFEALTKLSNSETKEEPSNAVVTTKKKFNELALSLQQMLQTVQTPDLLLSVHPEITKAVEAAANAGDGRGPVDFIPSSLLDDSIFLNKLQHIVNEWVKSVQDVSKLSNNDVNGSTLDEISFWSSLETALSSIQDQLASQKIVTTLDVLRKAKRFYATVSILSDTGLKEALVTANQYNQLLKDLPIDELLSASTFTKVEESIVLIMTHVKKLRVTSYPINRALQLVEAIVLDVDMKLKQILASNESLLDSPYSDFVNHINEINSVFATLDRQLKSFTNLARELLRKRSEKFIFVKINQATDLLKRKLEQISEFRENHVALIQAISDIMSGGTIFEDDGEATKASNAAKDSLLIQMNLAYNSFDNIDVSDTSIEGRKHWDSAESVYTAKSKEVESTMENVLRKILAETTTMDQMHASYAKFKFILGKSSLSPIIEEFHRKLLDMASADLANLQNHFVKQDESRVLFSRVDISKTAGTVIWVNQMKRKLGLLLNVLEAILGPKWHELGQLGGSKIYNEAMVFEKKLDVDTIFNKWLQSLSLVKIEFSVNNTILKIDGSQVEKKFKLVVNFNSEWNIIYKEVRTMCYQGFQVPHQVISLSRTLRKIYPFVTTVTESLETLYLSLDMFEDLEEFGCLVSDDRDRIFRLVQECFSISWDSLVKAHDMRVNFGEVEGLDDTLKKMNAFESFVSQFYERISKILKYKKNMLDKLVELTVCEFSSDVLRKVLEEVQADVDFVILNNFAQVDVLVNSLNQKIEEIFVLRVKDVLGDIRDQNMQTKLPLSKHEIIFQEMTISVVPPLEEANVLFYNYIQGLIDIARQQLKITHKSFDVNDASTDPTKFTHISRGIQQELADTVAIFETKSNACYEYFNQWNSLQHFWDLPTDFVESSIKDISSWIQLLAEVRETRKVFDTADTSKAIGAVILSYANCQARVSARYDAWQKEIVSAFVEVLGNKIKSLSLELSKAKTFLERTDLNVAATEATIQLIANVHQYKSSLDTWNSDIELLSKGQNVIVRFRYPFPSDWVHVEQLEGDYDALKQILHHRESQIDAESGVISRRLTDELARWERSVLTLKEEWIQKKPTSGNAAATLNILSSFDHKAKQLVNQQKSLETAVEILVLPMTFSVDPSPIMAEISDFQSVWTSISILTNSLNEIRLIKWADASPRTIRRSLDELLATSRSMPTKVRQYAAFDTTQADIKRLAKETSILGELKSDSLLDRHWQKLFKVVGKDSIPLEFLTVGNVWDIGLSFNEKTIKDIVAHANGERALQVSLENIKASWANTTFELFNYQGKCRLVKNWDSLFKRCSEDIDLLGVMKNSVFYPVFEAEAKQWTTKLNILYVLLDVWIDVQRQWVYLEGVFGDNRDIQRLLPVETARFQTITFDFFKLLKQLFKSPFVIDSIEMTGVQETMEKYLDTLSRIKKALGDYLERQREIFPRFYFIGNDDLLNIIGNSHDPVYIGRYLNKVYANIHGIEYDGTAITAIFCEQEVVPLVNPVFVKDSSLVEWLKELENELKQSLASYTSEAIAQLESIKPQVTIDTLLELLETYPCQVLILAFQVRWTQAVESAIGTNLNDLAAEYASMLKLVASAIIEDLSLLSRKKLENLIIELVHENDVINSLGNVKSTAEFKWRSNIRYYHENSSDWTEKVTVKIVDSTYSYGFEYLGLTPSLVKNEVIKRLFVCYSETLTFKKGGCAFGPAGTGKTESVKEFAKSLGRPVLVFNCDKSFDFSSISRILLGVCQIGASVCFDEFNRLEASMLSAVSSQLEKIELGLGQDQTSIDLLGKSTKLSPDTSIFITMNPTYAGRSVLPENIKKLFRSFSVDKTDKQAITKVLLFSQGFAKAEQFSSKIIDLFNGLESGLSSQIHYDFGLRAIKSTIMYCGRLRRSHIDSDEDDVISSGLKSSITPKLVEGDSKVFDKLMTSMFRSGMPLNRKSLIQSVEAAMEEENLQKSDEFIEKVLQLNDLISNHHGVMMVGGAGVGKSAARTVLSKALQSLDGVEGVQYIINPKVSKESLYGSMDLTTREFKDGLFTSYLRKVVANLRGELSKRIWIVFDGDVDPEWIESLNSLLDDNKIFTLPNGENIKLPQSVRIIFETDSLKYCTPATVSRCGMIWFSKDLVSSDEFLQTLIARFNAGNAYQEDVDFIKAEEIKSKAVTFLKNSKTFVNSAIEELSSLEHVFPFLEKQKLNQMMALFSGYVDKLTASYSENPSLYGSEEIEQYFGKSFALSLFWSFGSDCEHKLDLSEYLCHLVGVEPGDLVSSTVALPNVDWTPWAALTEPVDTNYDDVNRQLIIPTADTSRLEKMIDTFIEKNQFLILCGPPGSGKTMTVIHCLKNSSRELVSINFSGESTAQELMASLHQYCSYHKSSTGVTLKPKSGKELVCFIDEINLPQLDTYGSQPVISFLRQLIAYGEFYSETTNGFVKLEGIKFLGACNPASDQGRNVLSTRFLSHCPVLYVDYPARESLSVIYSTLSDQFLGSFTFKDSVIEAALDIYYALKEKIKGMSPRDLTRLMRSLFFGVKDDMTLESFLRLMVNESLRLFSDRCSQEQLKKEIFGQIKSTLMLIFKGFDTDIVFKQPIVFSKWLSQSYSPVDIDEFRHFVAQRLRSFSIEVLDRELVLYDECLDHIARLDRVLSLPQGHLILVGKSTYGKTILARFVAWVNGLKVVQLSVRAGFGLSDFDGVLKDILRRCGGKNEKICFVIDESNILETSFIERMNTLLANSEVPSLFSGTEFADLMSLCMKSSQSLGLLLDTEEELYAWFTQQISQNLHVIFTIGEGSPSAQQVLNSPALMNRCVVDWMGDWTNSIAIQVAEEMTRSISSSSVPQVLAQIHETQSALPDYFIRLVRKFVQVYRQQEQALEDRQRHVNVGLDKFRDTVLQVKDLRDKLSLKQETLRKKDAEAKEMLGQMLVDQNEAERRQEASIQVQEALKMQENELGERRSIVDDQLESMYPIIEAAAQNVKSIKKQNLSEIRSMNNPPDAVKMTLEAVCCLLGYGQKTSWREIQGIIRKDDFIFSILNFENQVNQSLRRYLEENYFSRPGFTVTSVTRASKACGPLLAWIEAQVKYAAVLEQVGPLRNEVAELEMSASQNRTKLRAINEMLEELEQKIEKYKDEYSMMIRETEMIKSEMAQVEAKVARSLALMESLTSERERWSEVSFETEKSYLAGNSVLLAAFLSYSGDMDQRERRIVWNQWKLLLSEHSIVYDESLTVADALSSPSESLKWQEHGLLNDSLYIENMVLIKDCDRYPLIIDSTGDIVNVLRNVLLPKKLIVTSFLDKGFLKQVEYGIRFGSPVLIDDAEYLDPVISGILKKEFLSTGGRLLVNLDGQNIDCAPGFKLYLHTKNPKMVIPPHVLGRTTVVNFTTTRSNLESKVLNLSLLAKEPEVETKRQSLIQSQDELKARLRKLEDNLLVSLGDASGNILDNDELIESLEEIKHEAQEVGSQIKQSTEVMLTIEEISKKFNSLAAHFSGIFAVLYGLQHVNSIYQFSLEYFVEILREVLKREDDSIKTIIRRLYKSTFERIVLSLKQDDRVLFALCLYLCYIQREHGDGILQQAKDICVTGEFSGANGSEECKNDLELFAKAVAANYDRSQLIYTVPELVASKFGVQRKDSITEVLTSESTSTTPIFLFSSEGYDPSFQIEKVAQIEAVPLSIIAMGSSETVDIVKNEMKKAAAAGTWVLVQNVQMAPEWLQNLSKQLESMTAAPTFRLVLTCYLNSDIPPTLLRSSRILTFEESRGMKNKLWEGIKSLGVETLSQPPVERRHVLFLLIWFHSLVMERCQYIPIGWHSEYDFNNTDFLFGYSIINRIINGVSSGRENVSPESIPWGDLHYLVGDLGYGAKVDDSVDYQEIMKIARSLFNASSFEFDFNLIQNEITKASGDKLSPPEGRTIDAYTEWISKLPEIEPPTWIGLQEDIENIVNENKGKIAVEKSLKLFDKFD